MRRLLPDQIAEAIAVLKDGGVLVYPTETSYGIGCDATRAEAVAQVFAVKGRPPEKGVTVLLPSLREAATYVQLTPLGRVLAERYWPGPLNIVAPRAHTSSLTTQCTVDGTHSVRVSSHPLAAALVRGLGVPVVSTSANHSGQPSAYTSEEIFAAFANAPVRPDAFLDVGTLRRVPPSTIVRCKGDGVRVLRQGSVVVHGV